MKERETNPYTALKRVFHEPNRLAIVSTLCHAQEGLGFNELKADLNLTDGNLSRHLKMLEEEGIVSINKVPTSGRPRTTAYLTHTGRESFMTYLVALEEVLKLAEEALEQTQPGMTVETDSLNTASA